MDLGLKGKVALVAGASQGMGRAVALGFAREGAKVSICARGEAQLKEAAEMIRRETGGDVLALVADMTRLEDIQKLVAKTVERFGRLDVVVTNAGGPPPGHCRQVPRRRLRSLFYFVRQSGRRRLEPDGSAARDSF